MHALVHCPYQDDNRTGTLTLPPASGSSPYLTVNAGWRLVYRVRPLLTTISCLMTLLLPYIHQCNVSCTVNFRAASTDPTRTVNCRRWVTIVCYPWLFLSSSTQHVVYGQLPSGINRTHLN